MKFLLTHSFIYTESARLYPITLWSRLCETLPNARKLMKKMANDEAKTIRYDQKKECKTEISMTDAYVAYDEGMDWFHIHYVKE